MLNPSPTFIRPTSSNSSSSSRASSPSSNLNSNYRSIRPRRSAASLRSIPERRSCELEPPLPVPATPWIEPATPALSSSNSNLNSNLNTIHHSHVQMDQIHLQPNLSNSQQFRLEDNNHHYSNAPHTVPGPRDQSSLSRFRIGSQPLTSRHSEGSQYASSSSRWTPSSTNGSRTEFDSSAHGMRSSIASRDSRFTAETDYEDCCQPQPSILTTSFHHPLTSQSQSFNLSVSSSWHGGDRPHCDFIGTCPNPNSPPTHENPTLISLINLDQTSPDQQDIVGLGITSDETISVTRGSRSPSLNSTIDASHPPPHPPNTLHNTRSVRSASSSVSHPNGSNLSPFNPLHSRPNRLINSSSERPVNPKPPRPDPPKSLISSPQNLYLSSSNPSQDTSLNLNSFSPTTSGLPNSNPFGLKPDPLSRSLLFYQGLPYDTSVNSNFSNNSTPPNSLSMSVGHSNRPCELSESVQESRLNLKFQSHFPETSLESQSTPSRPESNWDDFDEKSPSLIFPTQIPSQAIALVEEGRGCIVDISNSSSSLEKLEVPEVTTHLLLAKTFSPFVIGALLSSNLPTISPNLVVLDISDSSLNSLPSAIALCDALEELNVSGNVMASGDLPAFLSRLTSLKVLAADRCGLYQIASSYGALSHLRDLSVRFNHLRTLPSWLCLLPRLEILLIDGNEFDPLWQELVEPLLLSSYSSRLDSQPLPSVTSSGFTDERDTNLTSPVTNMTSFGSSTLKSLPESSLDLPPIHDDHRSESNTHRSIRGRRHLDTSNHTWVSSSSSAVSDQPDGSVDRPQSACSAEAAYTADLSTNSYLRRLRSTSDMFPELPQRSVSAQGPPGHALDSIVALDLLHGTTSTRPGSRRPSLTSGSQSFSNHATLNPHGIQAQPSRDNHKKSFGFLKKISLGKLRRDQIRPRTASIDVMSRASPNNLYSKPPSLAGSETFQFDPSKLAPEGLTPKENALLESEGLFKRVPLANLKIADPIPSPSVTKKRSNRRSYLKLDHSVSPVPLNSFNPQSASIEEETVQESPSFNEQDPPDSSTSKNFEITGPHESDTQIVPTASQQLPTLGHSASLRSIMMYLRDVHDLSGDVFRTHPGIATNSTRSVHSTSVSRTTSAKYLQNSTTLNGNVSADGRSTPVVPYSSSLVDLESDGLDSPSSAINMVGSSSSHEAPELVKVSDNALRRLKVIEEIVATEKSYIKGLKELHDIYITTASMMVSSSIGKEKEPMVPPSERKMVFNNVEAIIGFHVDVLLPDFQEVMDRLRQKQLGIAIPATNASDSSETRQKVEAQLTNIAAEELARVFIRHAAFLKLYSTYITQFETALERLREWRITAPNSSNSSSAWTPSSSNATNNTANNHTNVLTYGQKKRLKTFMKRCRAHSSHTQMNLESYLLMPVQRLPRYKLLLENLVSCTPDLNCVSLGENGSKANQDGVQKSRNLTANKVAVEALNIVSAVTAEMNERKRDSEGRQRLLYWQQRFGNKFRSPLVQPHRTLIKEGKLILMRTVKLTARDPVPVGNGYPPPISRNRVPVLNTDNQMIPVIVLLCTDLLVLVKDPGDGGRASNQVPASLFQALRLAQHSRPQVNLPATLFGVDRTIVRFVDTRAIFYFQCDCQRSAAAWMVAINQQVPLL